MGLTRYSLHDREGLDKPLDDLLASRAFRLGGGSYKGEIDYADD